MKSAAYPYPQWRRTPRYARLSRRRDAPRWRVGAGGRFAATLRGWASVPLQAVAKTPPVFLFSQPRPPCSNACRNPATAPRMSTQHRSLHTSLS